MNVGSMETNIGGCGSAAAEATPGAGTLQAAGVLWTRPALLFLSTMAVFASWNQQRPILVMSLLLLSFALSCYLWSRHCLTGVSCRRILARSRAFPDEGIRVEISIRNDKRLPVPWIRIEDFPPDALMAETDHEECKTKNRDPVSVSLFLPGRNRASWAYRLCCRRRGCYSLDSLKISSGDIFGLYTASRNCPATEIVLVYPRILPPDRLGIPSLQMLGDEKAERKFCVDPARPFGVRDHLPSDGLRHIHWKASARSLGLKQKIFEPTTTRKIALFFDAESFGIGESFRPDDFELGISTAASIAFHAGKDGAQIGVYANTRSADTGRPISIPPGGSRSQLVEILEAFAKATSQANGSHFHLLAEATTSLPGGTSILLVTGDPQNVPRNLLAALEDRGCRVTILPIARQTPPASVIPNGEPRTSPEVPQ